LIRTLITLSDFLGDLDSLLSLLANAVNFGETFLAEGTGVFTFRPFIDTFKAKLVDAAIDQRQILWLDVGHANATVFSRVVGCCRFLAVLVRFILVLGWLGSWWWRL
jgi:hypothetical protein